MIILISMVHVIVCLVLILVILLQAGRGGGLSEMFGGALTQSEKIFGTETNMFLTRATTTCAILFVLTSVTLGILTTQRSKSLVTGAALKPILTPAEAPKKEAIPQPAKVSETTEAQKTQATAVPADAAAPSSSGQGKAPSASPPS